MVSNIKTMVKENWKHAMALISYLIIAISYGIFNKPNVGKVRSLVTEFDINTPFNKYFIIPYHIWYPFILFSILYLIVKHREEYYRLLLGLDLGVIICYLIYIVFQTTVPRPELNGDDFFTKAVLMTYKADGPYNCFPSIHVFTTTMVVFSMVCSSKVNKGLKLLWCLIGGTILLSTLYVKQHVVMDLVGGVALSIIMFYTFRRVEEERLTAWGKKLYSSLMMKKKFEI